MDSLILSLIEGLTVTYCGFLHLQEFKLMMCT